MGNTDGGVLVHNPLWWAEEHSAVSLFYHRKVVIGIAGGKHLEVHGVEALNSVLLTILLPQLVPGDHVLVVDNQGVAEDGGPVELLHQRLRKLVKGVGENDCLGECAQLVHKGLGTIQRLHGGNHVLDILECQSMLLENLDSSLHKDIVVGDIPGGEPELLYPGLLGHINPDFRYQYSLKVKANNKHLFSPFTKCTVTIFFVIKNINRYIEKTWQNLYYFAI